MASKVSSKDSGPSKKKSRMSHVSRRSPSSTQRCQFTALGGGSHKKARHVFGTITGAFIANKEVGWTFSDTRICNVVSQGPERRLRICYVKDGSEEIDWKIRTPTMNCTMALSGNALWGAEMHIRLAQKLSPHSTCKQIRLTAITCMNDIHYLYKHVIRSPGTAIITCYDYESGAAKPRILLCESEGISATWCVEGYAFGGSCYSEFEDFFEKMHHGTKSETELEALNYAKDCASLAAGQAWNDCVDRVARGINDDPYVGGRLHAFRMQNGERQFYDLGFLKLKSLDEHGNAVVDDTMPQPST